MRLVSSARARTRRHSITVALQYELNRFEDRPESEPQLADVRWDEARGGAAPAGLLALLCLGTVALARPLALAG